MSIFKLKLYIKRVEFTRIVDLLIRMMVKTCSLNSKVEFFSNVQWFNVDLLAPQHRLVEPEDHKSTEDKADVYTHLTETPGILSL